MNETGNIYTLRSDRFTLGEYVTYNEISKYANKNNTQFAQFGECIRQIESNVSCSCGYNNGYSVNGLIYETFIHIDGDIYQYCGALYDNAELKQIQSFVDAETMIAVKEKAKEVSRNYIINFTFTVDPDFSKKIWVEVLSASTENIHCEINNCYVQFKKRRKYINEQNFLKQLIFDIEHYETYDIEQKFKNKIVLDYLTSKEKEYNKLNKNFYF